ncbi:HAD-IA family hydrolase [Candidatus Daviesbacteria bacterium]|nr:HAD-IA family hydrolase [Candidatus Daviesbacteria bacterium]
MTNREFDAALFDIDGTVLDTTSYILQAYQHTFRLHLDREITWEEVVPVMGLPLIECYRHLANLQEVDHLIVSHNEFQYQNLSLAVAYPNTLNTLIVLAGKGVGLGAITSRYGDQVTETLRMTGIGDHFQVIVTPLDVVKPKPDAESVVKALEYLKVSPERAVMIGDSPFDILAGKSAGTKTIGALYGFHGQSLTEVKPDYLVNDISEIIPIIIGGKQ